MEEVQELLVLVVLIELMDLVFLRVEKVALEVKMELMDIGQEIIIKMGLNQMVEPMVEVVEVDILLLKLGQLLVMVLVEQLELFGVQVDHSPLQIQQTLNSINR
tara:strand:+ start:344 stop:655 length:312 start_codon:yes stop_codon:yes gene_type:complete